MPKGNSLSTVNSPKLHFSGKEKKIVGDRSKMVEADLRASFWQSTTENPGSLNLNYQYNYFKNNFKEKCLNGGFII